MSFPDPFDESFEQELSPKTADNSAVKKNLCFIYKTFVLILGFIIPSHY